MAKVKKYDWSDAWLLLAIIYAGGASGAATLEKIIGAGDWINHAVFNADELESGLAGLTAGNFIKEKNKTFSATLKVKRAYAKTISRGRAIEKELDDIGQLIGAAATSEQLQINDLKLRRIFAGRIREAVNKHLTS